mgnify:CR=1 FL=1
MERIPGPPAVPPPAYAYKRGLEILQTRSNVQRGEEAPFNEQLAVATEEKEQLKEAMNLVHPGDTMGDLHKDTIKSIFAMLDSDHDGVLNDKEVQQALVALGLPPHKYLVAAIKSHVPARIGDKVDFDTFLRVVGQNLKANPVEMRDIQEVFRIFQDKEYGEHFVSETSLRHIMGLKPTVANALTPDEIDEIFRELGIKRRDIIDYRHFMKDISSGFIKFVGKT